MQRRPAAEGKGRKPTRPQLALFEEGAGKVVLRDREAIPIDEEGPNPLRTFRKIPAPAEPAPVAEVAPGPVTAAKAPARRVTAESLAKGQREISVSEFFVKNRHLLGFDNPSKALLTTIKEAVDNSLDACEEAGILPELHIEVHDLALEAMARDAELTKGEGRFLVVGQRTV